MQEIEPLADRLKMLQADSGRPFLVAIDGNSGAGKSTIARRLSQRLGAAVICGDDFYAGGTGLLQDSPEQLAQICIDRIRLTSVLQRLKSGRWANYAPFDWVSFDGSLADEPITVEPCAMMVLEGVYSNHPDVRPWVDLSVLLRVPEPERERRLHAREGQITAWERQWHRAEHWYFQHLACPEDFDLVLGEDD